MKKKIIILVVLSFIISTLFSIPASALTEWVFGQDVTAYVAKSGKKTASGETPVIGYVAVHPATWGSNTNPIFPFGAIIETTQSLYIPNTGSFSIFLVQDIGDVYNAKGNTKWWFDIYVGLDTQSNINNANQFGKQKADYKVMY